MNRSNKNRGDYVLVIRATKNLLKDMKIEKPTTNIDIADSLFSWHANLVLLDRRKHVVFMNDLSRLSLTLTGIRSTHYKNLKDIFTKQLNEYLLNGNFNKSRINEYLNECNEAIFTTTNNRSVISTLNDVVLIMQQVDIEFENYIELNRWNNDRLIKSVDPNKPREYLRPIEIFMKELENHYTLI